MVNSPEIELESHDGLDPSEIYDADEDTVSFFHLDLKMPDGTIAKTIICPCLKHHQFKPESTYDYLNRVCQETLKKNPFQHIHIDANPPRTSVPFDQRAAEFQSSYMVENEPPYDEESCRQIAEHNGNSGRVGNNLYPLNRHLLAVEGPHIYLVSLMGLPLYRVCRMKMALEEKIPSNAPILEEIRGNPDLKPIGTHSSILQDGEFYLGTMSMYWIGWK